MWYIFQTSLSYSFIALLLVKVTCKGSFLAPPFCQSLQIWCRFLQLSETLQQTNENRRFNLSLFLFFFFSLSFSDRDKNPLSVLLSLSLGSLLWGPYLAVYLCLHLSRFYIFFFQYLKTFLHYAGHSITPKSLAITSTKHFLDFPVS